VRIPETPSDPGKPPIPEPPHPETGSYGVVMKALVICVTREGLGFKSIKPVSTDVPGGITARGEDAGDICVGNVGVGAPVTGADVGGTGALVTGAASNT
jgi:hypothetical protein